MKDNQKTNAVQRKGSKARRAVVELVQIAKSCYELPIESSLKRREGKLI